MALVPLPYEAAGPSCRCGAEKTIASLAKTSTVPRSNYMLSVRRRSDLFNATLVSLSGALLESGPPEWLPRPRMLGVHPRKDTIYRTLGARI